MPLKKKFTRDRVEIVSNVEVARDHFAMTFADAEIAAETDPGQFCQVRLLGPEAPFLPRPFSIYDWHLDAQGRAIGFRILYKVVGAGTGMLSRLKPGDAVAVTGPLGNSFSAPGDAARVLMLAGGIGIAPFLAFTRRALSDGADPAKFSLLYGARNESLIVEEKPFRDLGVDMEVATDDGTRGVKGTVIDLLGRHCELLAPEKLMVYASGPTPMLNVVARYCAARGVRCEVTLEARMICGFGACNSCAVAVKSPKAPDGWEYKLICRDGPIFSAASLHLD